MRLPRSCSTRRWSAGRTPVFLCRHQSCSWGQLSRHISWPWSSSSARCCLRVAARWPSRSGRPRMSSFTGARTRQTPPPRRLQTRPPPLPATPVQAVAPAEVGYLRVVVRPWARVFIDGAYVDTTPFATRIPLSPGAHRVGLRNPYFESEDHVVEVRLNETSTVKVTLRALEEGR